jgi:hypothetical protein
MNQARAIGAQVTVGINPAVTCTPIVYVRNKNGRTVSSRTAIKSDLHGHLSTAVVASKSKIAAGPDWNFAAMCNQQRSRNNGPRDTVRDDETAFYQMTASGFFPGNGNVVDRPGRVIRSVAATSRSLHCMQWQISGSVVSPIQRVGMGAVERAAF